MFEWILKRDVCRVVMMLALQGSAFGQRRQHPHSVNNHKSITWTIFSYSSGNKNVLVFITASQKMMKILKHGHVTAGQPKQTKTATTKTSKSKQKQHAHQNKRLWLVRPTAISCSRRQPKIYSGHAEQKKRAYSKHADIRPRVQNSSTTTCAPTGKTLFVIPLCCCVLVFELFLFAYMLGFDFFRCFKRR